MRGFEIIKVVTGQESSLKAIKIRENGKNYVRFFSSELTVGEIAKIKELGGRWEGDWMVEFQ